MICALLISCKFLFYCLKVLSSFFMGSYLKTKIDDDGDDDDDDDDDDDGASNV